MRGLNGKPYLSCDNFIDVNRLESLEDEISLGIAQSNWISGTSGSGMLNQKSKNSVYFFEEKFPIKKERLITYDHIRKYMKIRHGLQNSCYSVYLRQPLQGKLQSKRAIGKYCRITQNHKYFPELNKFIKDLPFNDVGRVIIFLVDHFGSVPIHTDRVKQDLHKSEFIWMRTNYKKKFFVYDVKNKTKFYPKSKVLFFNDVDYHGVDPSDEMSFSIRVDGVFKNSFREELGIDSLRFY